MKDLLILLFLIVISTEGRLIQVNRTKIYEELQTDKPNPSIRLTRDIEDMLMGFSNEEIGLSDEFVRSHNKRAKNFNKYNMNGKPPLPKPTRRSRDSTEPPKKPKKVVPSKSNETPDTKKVLVKKPIPKFNDIDYDDDFQAKMNRFLTAVVESGEHEDEDFNVDDYDFDINHDEYSGRGKPLEPRINYKPNYAKAKMESKPEKRILNKLIGKQNKKGRSADSYDALGKNKEMDYYYDFTTKPQSKNKLNSDSDYEDDESSDLDKKSSSIRKIRSWDIAKYANRISGKTPVNIIKLLSFLPIFPQMPSELEELEEAEYEATGNFLDPTRRKYI